MSNQTDGVPFFYTQKGTWYVWKGGRRVSLGVRGKANRREALDALGRLGTADIPIPQHTPAQTVAEAVDAFLSHVQGTGKPWTLKTYKRHLTPFREAFAGRTLVGMTPKEVESYARKPTWNDTTRHGTLKAIQTAFRFAGVSLALTVPPKRSRGAEAVVSEGDVCRIVDAARGDFGTLYRFLWLTGCRPSEAFALTFADVDTGNGVCRLTDHKTAHTGKTRLIFLSPEAVALIRSQRERYGDGVVFRTSTGKAFTLNNAVNILWRLNRKLGTSATLYGMRHTFATDALSRGVPDAHVAALLGHSSTAMLHRHYSHLTGQSRVLLDALGKVRGS